MTTHTVDQHQGEVTTHPVLTTAKELSDESRMNFALSQLSVAIRRDLITPPQADLYSYCRKLGSIARADPVTELLLAQFRPFMTEREDAGQTETILSEDRYQLSDRSAFSVSVSRQVATELRQKEVRAFVPIAAADLVWLEAQSMDDADDE